MKGNTAKHILKWLSERRFRDFISYAKLESNGEYVASMCRYFRKHQVTTEEGTCAHFQITPQQYYYRISVIGQRLTTFMAGSKGSVFLHQRLWLADEMISEMQFAVAEDIIQNGAKAAVEIEDFDLALRFCHLVDSLPEEFRPTDLNVSMISGLRRNLLAFEDMLDRVREAGKIVEVEVRRVAMRDFLKDPLLSSIEVPRSQKAIYFGRKARYICHIFLGEYLQAIQIGKEVIQQLKDIPYLISQTETAIAKETTNLAQLLGLTQQLSLCHEVMDEFEVLPLRTPRAQFERIFVKYPASISLARETGNGDAMAAGIDGFIKLLDRTSLPLPESFITTNLYTCAYGAIALGSEELWELTFPRLVAHQKGAFVRLHYPMYRFIEIIHSLDKKEWEDAIRQLRNLRAIKQIETFPDFLEFLGMFSTAIQAWATVDQVAPGLQGEAFWDKVLILNSRFEFSEYFDFPAWLESHRRECSMIEIFYHRTLASFS